MGGAQMESSLEPLRFRTPARHPAGRRPSPPSAAADKTSQ